MKKKLLVFLVALLALLTVLVACNPDGGDGDDEDTYTASFILGYGSNDIIDTREIEVGGRLGKLHTPPERDGYTFGGWFVSTDLEYEDKVTSSSRFEEDVILVAYWIPDPPCDHSVGYENAAVTAQTCESPSVLIQRCLNCGATKETELQPALGHKIKTNDPVAANCGYDGYTLKECTRKGCKWEEKVDIVPATGIHTRIDRWFLVRTQTDYSYGEERRPCNVCGLYEYRYIEPNKLSEFNSLPIKQVVRDNQVYVDVASTGLAYATSLYRLTQAGNVIDGAPGTYWRADTLVDNNTYAGDVLNLKLAQAFDVAVIEFTIPNYWGWNLGPECTVKFDIEVCENGEWIKVGTISDADAQDPVSKNAVVALELDRIYNITEVRATVTHATRYTPAMICEIKVYGKVEEFKRAPQSVGSIVTGSITGSYNSWVDSSAENLLDNNGDTSWCTDARVWRDEMYYGRSTNIITNWVVTYDNDNDETTLSTATKTISKVVVNTEKLIGQSFNVVACRQWMEPRMVKEQTVTQVPDLDEEGNQKVDENGDLMFKDVYEDVLDPETNKPVYVQATDENGDPIYDMKTEWFNLYSTSVKDSKGSPATTVTIDANSASSYEFVPMNDGSATTLSDIVAVRVEVDNYGADDTVNKPGITSVKITEDGNDSTYSNLEWNLRRRVYAQFDFPQSTYVAYLDISCNKDVGRVMSIQIWKEDSTHPNGGYWEEYGDKIQIYENSAVGGTVLFTRDFGFYVTKIRVEITVEPAIYGAYIKDIIPYTVAEIATELPNATGCKHKYSTLDPVEIVLPTCTTAGYSVFKCFTCDFTWKTDAVDMTGHKWDQGTTGFDGLNEVKTYKCKTGGCKASKKEITRLYDSTAQGYISAPTVTKYFHNANGAWSMTFDDGNYIDTYEWVIPQFTSRNMTATAVITAQYAGSYVNEWRRYLATGAFDMGSHSTKHGGPFHSDPADEAVLIKEIDDAHFTFMSWFPGQRILGFATPNGATGKDTAKFVNDLMMGGRSGGQAGTYCDPDTLTSREAWGNMPSYIAYATTKFEGTSSADGVSYKGAIDYLSSKKLWTVECIHTIYTGATSESDVAGDKFSVNKYVFEKKLDYLVQKGVWVASYTEAIQYFREAHAAEIKNMSATGTAISFEVTDGLDDTMLNHPLTFQFGLPNGWTNVTVTQNGVEIPMVSSSEYAPNMEEEMACTIIGGVLYFDAIPDAGTVVITKK